MEEEQRKKKAAYLSVLSNSVLLAAKLIVGFAVGSMSIVAEAVHSSMDLVASFLAALAVKLASAPPDKEHDYGHGKFENLSALFEALLIIFAGIGIVFEASNNFFRVEVPENLSLGIWLMLFSAGLNFFVSQHLLKVAKETKSQALLADALHLRGDVYTSVGIFLGILLIKFTGWIWLDPVIALCVAGIIFRAGIKLVISSVAELTDTSLSEVEEKNIGNIITSCPEVRDYHCLRTRRSGSYKLLDVHVLFDGNMPLSRVHAVCDEIEQEIRSKLGNFDVLIHAESQAPSAGEESIWGKKMKA